MRRLYVMRHGLAVPPGTPGLDDDARALTPQGEKRVRQVAFGMKRMGVKLDRIVTSPMPRAHRTAEIVAAMFDDGELVEVAPVLRVGQNAGTVVDWLGGRPEQRLMIVGHDPTFSDLVAILMGASPSASVCSLSKAGVAAFAVQPGGGSRLDWLIRPRVIRRLVD